MSRTGSSAPPAARRRIATLVDYYLPGYKAGGAIRTVAAMAEQLRDELDLRVVTRDRDAGDSVPYPGAVRGEWTETAGGRVRYLAPAERTARGMATAIRGAGAELLYLNSAFSPPFTVLPLLLRRIGRIGPLPVVVAPRGELSDGALRHKRLKKLAFLRAARVGGLFRSVLWQASSEAEAEEVRRWFGARARVMVAPDLRDPPPPPFLPARKARGELRVAFLSRIARKKNLMGALDLLAEVEGDVRFTVYGPVDDPAYWEECRARIARLPPGVRVEAAGPVERGGVHVALASHHLFLFPTLGENFGHVVVEALLSGLPVLTTDRTPWSELEPAGAGWALPLEDPAAFAAVLRACVDDGPEAHARRSAAARAFGERVAADPAAREANRALFRRALLEGARGGTPREWSFESRR